MTDDPQRGRGDRGGGGGRGRRVGTGLLGAAVALPVLAVVAVGAAAERPPAAGDGAWTTPIEVALGLVAVGLVATLVLLVRNLAGGLPRTEGRSSRSGAWLLVAAAIVVLVGLSRLPPDADEPVERGATELGGVDGAGAGGDRLPTSTTAVLAGLAAVGLLGALTVVALGRTRRGGATDTAHDQPVPGDSRGSGPPDLPAEPPDEVVLAAWAAARHHVVAHLDGGEHDPPGRLLERVAGTPVAEPLRTLTALYLPVRYGRAPATRAQAASARRALDDVRRHDVGADR